MTQAISNKTQVSNQPWRRHTDPPGLWFLVVTVSVILHLLAIWLIRFSGWNLFGQQNSVTVVPIDFVEVAPAKKATKLGVGDRKSTAKRTPVNSTKPVTPNNPSRKIPQKNVAGDGIALTDNRKKKVTPKKRSPNASKPVTKKTAPQNNIVKKQVTQSNKTQKATRQQTNPTNPNTGTKNQPQTPTNSNTRTKNQPPQTPTTPNTGTKNQPPQTPTNSNTGIKNQPPQTPTNPNTGTKNQPQTPTTPNTRTKNQPPQTPTNSNTGTKNQPQTPTTPNTGTKNQPPQTPTNSNTGTKNRPPQTPTNPNTGTKNGDIDKPWDRAREEIKLGTGLKLDSNVPSNQPSSSSDRNQGGGIIVRIDPLSRKDVLALKLRSNAPPDKMAEYLGSKQDSVAINILTQHPELKAANLLASLVIDKNGKFEEAFVLRITPQELAANKTQYQKFLNTHFRDRKFKPAANNNGTKPEVSNLILKIVIEEPNSPGSMLEN
ncbi:MAG: hypothetical protein QNJ51_08305 [Calothrix sp. MO_167.B12]|nr:hypothetical protein [Calothrix sp. MO_167.B12]